MDIGEYVRILRTRWVTIVLTVVVVVLGTLAASLLVRPEYQSSTRLFVSTSGGSSVGDTYQNNLFSQGRVASYTVLVTDEELASRTIAALGLDLTPEELTEKVAAIATPETVLLDIRVTDTSPTLARDIANGMAGEFVGLVRELETPDNGGAPSAGVKVVQPAKIPTDPVSPKTERNLVIAVVAGFVLGVGLAVLRDRLDNTVKGRRGVEALTDVPVIGSIPYDKQRRDHPTLDYHSGWSASVEAFREFRTNLQFLNVDNPPRVLVITSAVPGEGKSTTSINLAVSLAEAGHHVVLVEGDLRKPRLSEYLGLPSGAGLSTILAGNAAIADVLQPTSFDNILVLSSGPLPPNASELLSSDASRQVIEQLRARFDYVVVDGSPLLPVTDSAVLSTYCDGAILVTKSGSTKREDVTRALGNLERVGARVLGIVLSQSPTSEAAREMYSAYYEKATSAAPAPDATNPSAPVVVAWDRSSAPESRRADRAEST
ncbi:polysaccharide biosynthesis tyrosine autokinase [Rhodococcus kroppenstedtii]|uniref:polysaccharide biosynthesis tyrosine autokinase n=1 Tax=Rhodococcoides kroppenstedtii TaxID=293050 RepID=UPI001C9B2C32|nr:polysaccharide biosynthesis tyrosine autokinase [Rhodococcus kroppenstedtii]MBY6437555.1 polysaccharide biosynthesis tyrosine autokinase [Rhodococcus kroppenstedtii]